MNGGKLTYLEVVQCEYDLETLQFEIENRRERLGKRRGRMLPSYSGDKRMSSNEFGSDCIGYFC